MSVSIPKRILHFVGSCLLPVVFSSRTITQKEHLNIHDVVAELVVEDLVTNEVFHERGLVEELLFTK